MLSSTSRTLPPCQQDDICSYCTSFPARLAYSFTRSRRSPAQIWHLLPTAVFIRSSASTLPPGGVSTLLLTATSSLQNAPARTISSSWWTCLRFTCSTSLSSWARWTRCISMLFCGWATRGSSAPLSRTWAYGTCGWTQCQTWTRSSWVSLLSGFSPLSISTDPWSSSAFILSPSYRYHDQHCQYCQCCLAEACFYCCQNYCYCSYGYLGHL